MEQTSPSDNRAAMNVASDLRVFAKVDEVRKRILAKAAKVVEVNSKISLGEDASADELANFYEIAQREAQLVPETLFYWPIQKLYVMVFEVDGETWIYRSEDPTESADFAPLSVALPTAELPAQDDSL